MLIKTNVAIGEGNRRDDISTLNKHYVQSACVQSYSGPYFTAFGPNKEIYFVFLRIQSECGKIRTKISPNTDTFYAVKRCPKLDLNTSSTHTMIAQSVRTSEQTSRQGFKFHS